VATKLKWYQWLKKAEEQRRFIEEMENTADRIFAEQMASSIVLGIVRKRFRDNKRTRRTPSNQRNIAIRRDGRGW